MRNVKQRENVNVYLQNKAKTKTLKENPKEGWSMVFKLMEGFQSHHKTFIPKNFKNKPAEK